MAGSNGRQFVKYNFFKLDPLWRRLSEVERTDSKREFAAVVEESASHTLIRSYSLVGLRGDADFLLWQAADSLESLQDVATGLWGHRAWPLSHPALLVPGHDPSLGVRRQAHPYSPASAGPSRRRWTAWAGDALVVALAGIVPLASDLANHRVRIEDRPGEPEMVGVDNRR